MPRPVRPRMPGPVLLAAMALGLATAWSAAQSADERAWPSRQHPGYGTALPPMPCTCRAQGHDFRMGERACLRTAGGPRYAVCGMELNNSSWLVSDEPCPES